MKANIVCSSNRVCGSSTLGVTMALTERWVNDKLYDILGISDKYIAQYMIGLASKANSPDDFVDQLKATQTVDVDNNVIAFAKELFQKVLQFYWELLKIRFLIC